MTTNAATAPAQEIATPEERTTALLHAFEARALVPDGYLESFRKTAEEEWSHRSGAALVARAWLDDDFRQKLLSDGTTTVQSAGHVLPPQHKRLVVLENTASVHNVIVCTLCSCTAFTLMGVAPGWYKDLEYRARVVREARTVLAEMGLTLAPQMDLRVWDTTADTRYMVLPMRPAGTDGWSAQQLADLVTKESLIGVERIADQEG